MAYEGVKIRELVDRAVAHSWSIPEFQRGFVSKSTQVRDLLESLWLDYPIGSLLVWNSSGPVEEQHAHDAQRPALWVVDGQQRTTALCILFGRKPYWWPSVDDWNKAVTKYDIRFDVNATEPPYFWVANAVSGGLDGRGLDGRTGGWRTPIEGVGGSAENARSVNWAFVVSTLHNVAAPRECRCAVWL
jgi:uncharacterized protein DUF262